MLFETTYSYAGFEINAATDDEGNYWISYRTIENILEISKDSTRKMVESKSLEVALGKSFQLGKCSDKTNKSNSKKNFLSVQSFLAIIAAKAKPIELENKTVPALPRAVDFALAGLSSDFMTSLKHHFGETFSEDEKEYLRELVFNRLQAFRAWTDIIRDRHIKFYGKKPEGWYYGKLIKKANKALFGVPDFGSDRTSNMTKEQQETIKDFERFLARKAKNNSELEPEALLDIVINNFTS